MPIYLYKIKLHLEGPILSHQSGSRVFGLDTPTIRDETETPALPGSLVRGNLRHAWVYFAKTFPGIGCPDSEKIKAWLGEQSPQDSNDEPRRAQLQFAYRWVADKSGDAQRFRHRIKIDSGKGTVEAGALQMLDEPFGAGDAVVFSGWIKAHLDPATDPKDLQKWLHKGLNYVTALGALKGVGFGRLLKAAVAAAEEIVPQAEVKLPDSGQFGICLTPDRPICCARHHSADDNRFEAEDFIPGAAIRGVLARMVFPEKNSAYPALAQHFDKVLITHAQPTLANSGTRPIAIPLSFVTVKDDNKKLHLYDVAKQAVPGLLHDKAPTFLIDWKGEEWGCAEQACQRPPAPSRNIEVHTAINASTNTAEEGALFALETVSPFPTDKAPDGYHWIANVDCSLIIDDKARREVLDELEQLLPQGLGDLSKTQAFAEVRCQPKPYSFSIANGDLPTQKDELLIVILQSAARLLPDPYNIASSNDGDALKLRYAEVWKNLSNESLELSHFYAQQQLVGGGYLWRRFWQSRGAYNPELLTVAGSVFVFTVQKVETAQVLLQEWLQCGLPQPANAAGGEQWDKNPYNRANGYGEIMINPQWTPGLSVEEEKGYAFD